MSIILDIEKFKIYKKNNLFEFTIKNDLLFYYFITNCSKFIIKDTIDYENNIVYIKNYNISTISNFLHYKNNFNYKKTEKFIKDIVKQIHFFEENNYCIEYLHPNDILIIDNDNYLFYNTSILHEYSNGEFTIIKPFKKNKFMSYEQILVKSIPCKLTTSACYYSFGVLASFILLNLDINYDNIEQILEPVNDTPIYFFIKRCVRLKTNERFLFFI